MVKELLIGTVLPPFVDLINFHIKDSRVKYVVSLLFSLTIGAIAHWQELSLENVLESGAIIFGAAQTAYKIYFEKSAMREKYFKMLK